MSTPDSADSADAGLATSPVDRLLATPIGTRIVVRSRIVSGFTDTIGELLGCDGTVAQLATRSGPQQVVVAHVVAMRVVPPPPERRRPGQPRESDR